MQRFIARVRRDFTNGAVGWAPGGPMDCLGPYAKVENCPIKGTNFKHTAYATGYADTFFSVPARTRHKGAIITGFLTSGEDGPVFVPHTCEQWKLTPWNEKRFRLIPCVEWTEGCGDEPPRRMRWKVQWQANTVAWNEELYATKREALKRCGEIARLLEKRKEGTP